MAPWLRLETGSFLIERPKKQNTSTRKTCNVEANTYTNVHAYSYCPGHLKYPVSFRMHTHNTYNNYKCIYYVFDFLECTFHFTSE